MMIIMINITLINTYLLKQLILRKLKLLEINIDSKLNLVREFLINIDTKLLELPLIRDLVIFDGA